MGPGARPEMKRKEAGELGQTRAWPTRRRGAVNADGSGLLPILSGGGALGTLATGTAGTEAAAPDLEAGGTGAPPWGRIEAAAPQDDGGEAKDDGGVLR